MGANARNADIVNKFLASKAFDFVAFGKFVAENGQSIATSGDGEFGFIIGNHLIRYCIPPVVSLTENVDPAELAADVVGA